MFKEIEKSILQPCDLPKQKELLYPVHIEIQKDDAGDYMVTEERFFMYGIGKTKEEAIVGFKLVLSGYYDFLEPLENKLEGKLQRQLYYLKSMIVNNLRL